MSKLLKLTGIASFSCPAFRAEIVKKGQVVRVDDSLADKLSKGSRRNNEGEDVPYWTESHDGGEPAFDFSTVAAQKDAPAEASPAPAETRRSGSRQRARA